MGTIEMLAIIMLAQFILCAGIIKSVELLKDIRDELEERKNEKC